MTDPQAKVKQATKHPAPAPRIVAKNHIWGPLETAMALSNTAAIAQTAPALAAIT